MTSRLQTRRADTVVVLDFETTGLSPHRGDRAIEIGAVKLESGRVVDRFQELMNPGFRVSGFIQNYTGISNAMLAKARPCGEVMNAFADFLGDASLVAHNASFDRRFLEAELALIGRRSSENYACTVLVCRRLIPEAPSYKLGNLVHSQQIPTDGVFHRALADAEMTSHLWLHALRRLQGDYGLPMPTFALMQKLSGMTKAKVPSYLRTAAEFLNA